jgi:alkanesulfonate monooxygenase SsuD/methylene tetrahydromethanopterin reductase-like flavin-dependent oxidoreductase (luciferase family)
MNAGMSSTGVRFSAKNSQISLINLEGNDPEEWRPKVEAHKRMAREEFRREIQIWTNVSVVQRETHKEAEDYLRRYSEEYLETEALDGIMSTRSKENNILEAPSFSRSCAGEWRSARGIR